MYTKLLKRKSRPIVWLEKSRIINDLRPKRIYHGEYKNSSKNKLKEFTNEISKRVELTKD